jgi:hypothetical protein
LQVLVERRLVESDGRRVMAAERDGEIDPLEVRLDPRGEGVKEATTSGVV